MQNASIPTAAPPYLQGLNDPQRAAIEALDGPVLVLAGAGTGKTRVLTARLAHLLRTGRCYPSQILAVTFTNKAAGEMKERVSKLLDGQPVAGWWLGTFHALAARQLRQHADRVGLDRNFTIIDPRRRRAADEADRGGGQYRSQEMARQGDHGPDRAFQG